MTNDHQVEFFRCVVRFGCEVFYLAGMRFGVFDVFWLWVAGGWFAGGVAAD